MSAGDTRANARRTPLRRVAAMGVTASLLCAGAVFSASPASAETIHRSVNVAAVDCAKGEKFTIHSRAQGIVIHRWRLGPSHLGYRSQGGKVGASLASVYDKTITSNRAVYSAVVIAKTYQDREPHIYQVFADCT